MRDFGERAVTVLRRRRQRPLMESHRPESENDLERQIPQNKGYEIWMGNNVRVLETRRTGIDRRGDLAMQSSWRQRLMSERPAAVAHHCCRRRYPGAQEPLQFCVQVSVRNVSSASRSCGTSSSWGLRTRRFIISFLSTVFPIAYIRYESHAINLSV